MCPFDEQQLDRLLKQPMPNLNGDQFQRQTLKNNDIASKQRLHILLIFSLIGFISLLWFLPFSDISQALSKLNILQLHSVQMALSSAMPLFMIALVGYFIKDDQY